MPLTQPTINQPQSQPPSSMQKPLPPPQLFDILPALHELLARIDHSSTNGSDPDLLPSSGSDPGAATTAYADLQPLDPKELLTAILPLKTQMRKGLREVEQLPDMARSVAEQEEEIAELEERIRRQEAVMRGLVDSARGMVGRVGGGG